MQLIGEQLTQLVETLMMWWQMSQLPVTEMMMCWMMGVTVLSFFSDTPEYNVPKQMTCLDTKTSRLLHSHWTRAFLGMSTRRHTQVVDDWCPPAPQLRTRTRQQLAGSLLAVGWSWKTKDWMIQQLGSYGASGSTNAGTFPQTLPCLYAYSSLMCNVRPQLSMMDVNRLDIIIMILNLYANDVLMIIQ